MACERARAERGSRIGAAAVLAAARWSKARARRMASSVLPCCPRAAAREKRAGQSWGRKGEQSRDAERREKGEAGEQRGSARRRRAVAALGG